MKILFIGSRLYDDVDYFVKQKGIEIFYRIGLSPNAFWFIDFLFGKNH